MSSGEGGTRSAKRLRSTLYLSADRLYVCRSIRPLTRKVEREDVRDVQRAIYEYLISGRNSQDLWMRI